MTKRMTPEERRNLDAIEMAGARQRSELAKKLPEANSHRDRSVIARADAKGVWNSATRS